MCIELLEFQVATFQTHYLLSSEKYPQETMCWKLKPFASYYCMPTYAKAPVVCPSEREAPTGNQIC